MCVMKFHLILYNWCNYLCTLGLKLIHVSERGTGHQPRWDVEPYVITDPTVFWHYGIHNFMPCSQDRRLWCQRIYNYWQWRSAVLAAVAWNGGHTMTYLWAGWWGKCLLDDLVYTGGGQISQVWGKTLGSVLWINCYDSMFVHILADIIQRMNP